jgi:hypothetical protein
MLVLCAGYWFVNNPNRGTSNCVWTVSSSLLLTIRVGEPTAVRELQDVYPFSTTQSVWVVNEDRKKMPTIPSPLLPQQCTSPHLTYLSVHVHPVCSKSVQTSAWPVSYKKESSHGGCVWVVV